MKNLSINKIILFIFFIILIFISIKFVLPLLLPFLLGGLLSFTAEPAVRIGCRKLHLKRPVSAALGVSLTLAITLCAALGVGALAVREVKALTQLLPNLRDTAQEGITTLQENLLILTRKAPEGIRPVLERSITTTLGDGEGLLQLSSRKIPSMLSALAGKLPGSALGIGTGVLAAFLISARLPQIKQAIHNHIPEEYRKTWLPALRRIRKALGKWLLAQGKLMLVTYGIVWLGLWLLKIPYAASWAAFAAVVDAVPLLGTGIILVPWALVKLMQAQYAVAAGLLGVYAAAMLTRTVLEPRLVGKQLGLDPLATLAAIYIGYRLWGFLGLILAPVGAALLKNLLINPQQAT